VLAGVAETFSTELTMHLSFKYLLHRLIDYAGLFPPAALDMTSAVRNYAAYYSGEQAWMLGRFVVPVARLNEFRQAAAGLLPDGGWEGDDYWRLSALAGADLAADLETIASFNHHYATLPPPWAEGLAKIDTIEIKVNQPTEIERLMKLIPDKLTPYFEIPIADDPAELVKAIADVEARAKVRTGGVTPDALPSSHDLARFIATCAKADVPFKATAGLHHPLRSVNRLTYEPGSATALMHGFLNVFIAAGFAQFGLETELLVEILEEREPEAFVFDSGGVRWRGHDLVLAHLRNTRSLFAISFGSCSFAEPVEDLRRLGLL
jgi:hypothetical protein